MPFIDPFYLNVTLLEIIYLTAMPVDAALNNGLPIHMPSHQESIVYAKK